MLLILQATAEQIEHAQEFFAKEHAQFYAQPHGHRKSASAAVHALFNAPMGTLHYGYNEPPNGLCGWITSGENVVLLNPHAATVTYSGTRHGMTPLWVLDKPNSHEILKYESSMDFLSPFETLDSFAYRARLDSVCPMARGLALLNSGKPLAFLHAEGLPVATITRVYAECIKRGYI